MSSSTLSARPGFSACQFLTVSASYWYVLNGRPRLRDSHTANIMNCVGFSMSDELCLTVHLPVKFVLSPVTVSAVRLSPICGVITSASLYFPSGNITV